MIQELASKSHVISAPAADFLNGDITTDAVDMRDANGVRILIPLEATASTQAITVYKCNAAKGSATAIAFHYRETVAGVAGALAAATASGFTSAAADTLIELFISAQALGDKGYLYVDIDETDATATVGCVLADIIPRSSH